jgi:5'-nucleotidase
MPDEPDQNPTPPLPSLPTQPPLHRRLFCNRTLNLRSIKVIGYDMDYTLIHYHADEWEGRAYAHLRQRLLAQGWPVEHLLFEPDRVQRGLVIDKQLGNILKVNRFGYIKQSMHGLRIMTMDEQRQIYGRTLVDLADSARYVFLNTLFEVSEGCMFAQLVEMLDDRKLPETLGYEALYRRVRFTLDRAHVEGELKAEILATPTRYVSLDPELPLALVDQREAGKKLVLITNSEWTYTQAMMSYAFDQYLPEGQTWRDLFAYVVVSARKPAFFSANALMFEVMEDSGLLRLVEGDLHEGKVYFGGSADRLEKALGVDGDQIMYVGDHMLTDVLNSKKLQQWRTALILRELEAELEAQQKWRPQQQKIDALMAEKEALEFQFSQMRAQRQRRRLGYGPQLTGVASTPEAMTELRDRIIALDAKVAPLVALAGQIHNRHWGLLMRTGNDKSLLARQIEHHADIYTSRVSNFLYETPFVFLRSLRGTLPHDRE